MTVELYIQELKREKDVLHPQDFAHAVRLLEKEIHNVEANNFEAYQSHLQSPINGTGQPLAAGPPAGPYEEEVIQLAEKIYLPIEENPNFNFVGKIIGPRGSIMKAIQANTKTRLSVLGRGSTRDLEKEAELSQGDDPKNEHFKEPLHILISVRAPRSEAHERIAHCVEEIDKCFASDEGGRPPVVIKEERPADTNTFSYMTQAPIIKVGIPPPGAIILNGPAQANGRPRKTGGVTPRRGGGGGRGRPY